MRIMIVSKPESYVQQSFTYPHSYTFLCLRLATAPAEYQSDECVRVNDWCLTGCQLVKYYA